LTGSTSNQADGNPTAGGTGGAAAPRLSIALCTYNGARFLEAQLESYQTQTRLPDELVVCDDGSTDATRDILEAFARQARFPVHVHANPVRLGATKNFEKAIGLCSGDFIATSDQDDVWLPMKLAASERALAEDPGRGLVFTDAEVVDESLRPVGHRMWDAIKFGASEKSRVRGGRAFEVLLRRWVVTGATMMFRARYRDAVLPIPDNWVHDGWIAFIISAVAVVAFVPEATIKYRQHSAQQIGGRKLDWRALYRIAREVGPPYYRLSYERCLPARDRLLALREQVRHPEFLRMMDGKVDHQRRRLAIIESPSRLHRLAASLDELVHGRYRRYSPNLGHFIKDMIF
jgi:glycosyltransferase involved in cell wall biosynthesis